MRRLIFIVGLCLTVSSLAGSPPSADAATIEGRVVDSDGKPLARAEVRIWQKVRGSEGRFIDRPVEFGGRDMLFTDAEGRFVSPDVLVAGVPAQIVAEAAGMVAGRSGWIQITKDAVAVNAPDITLKGLRIITGRVLDRRGQPVDGATVFNSGDGHQRVEARSKGGGKFLLTEVPKGGAFLFAEKPGYRFTGLRLAADQAEATLALTSLDEPAEPKATLPPLLSRDEEYALARAVLDPWLEQLAKTGTPDQRLRGFSSWTQLNGLEAFQRLDWLGDMDKSRRDILRHNAICSVIAHRERISWDEALAMIEAGGDEYQKAAELIRATDAMGEGEKAMRLEWLESAVPHARKVDDPARRVGVLASLAEHLFATGEVALARQVFTEAEADAKPLFPDYAAQYAFIRLALAAMHDDVDRAVGWLAKSGIYLKWHGGRVAVGMLPERPQRAVEVWQRVVEAMRDDRSRTGLEYCAAAEFCYRLALVDRALAERVAADADETVLRYREKGAILLAQAATEPAEARHHLAALVRDELSQLPAVEFRLLPLESAPAIAAWLLPVAEKVDPDLCGELFWRSLALRLPRPRRNDLNGRAERTDIALAKLLARYDRAVGRALLEPVTAKAFAPDRFLAALEIDPHWAKNLLDTVYDVPSSTETANRFRFYLIQALALPLRERWNGRDGFDSVSFWQPSAQEKPLPP